MRHARGVALQRADAVGEVATGRDRLAQADLVIGGYRAHAGAVAHRFGGEDRVDRRIRPFQRRRQPRHFGGDVVDALAQQRVLHPLGRPGFLGLALDVAEFARQPVAFIDGAVEFGLELGLFRLQRLGRRTGAVVELGDGHAQVAFGLARGVEIDAQLFEPRNRSD